MRPLHISRHQHVQYLHATLLGCRVCGTSSSGVNEDLTPTTHLFMLCYGLFACHTVTIFLLFTALGSGFIKFRTVVCIRRYNEALNYKVSLQTCPGWLRISTVLGRFSCKISPGANVRGLIAASWDGVTVQGGGHPPLRRRTWVGQLMIVCLLVCFTTK
jgi:hypothetical protein